MLYEVITKRLFITGKRQWLDLVNASREVTQSQISLATLRAVFVTSAYSYNFV